MSAESTVGHLRALWRTERIIADIRLKHLLGGLGLKALAALFAGCGLLLLELGAYFALVQSWSAIVAAVALGVFNLVLAALLVVVASKRPLPRELALALEVEDSAVAALQGEARAFQATGSPPFVTRGKARLPLCCPG